VPFRKEIRQRQELRIIQAVAILHGCPKLLMPSSLLERSTPQTSPVPPFRLPNSHVLYRPRNIIISLRVQESRTAKLAGTLSGSAPIPSLCSLRWQGGPAIRTLLAVIFSAVKIVMLLDLGLPLSFAKLALTSSLTQQKFNFPAVSKGALPQCQHLHHPAILETVTGPYSIPLSTSTMFVKCLAGTVRFAWILSPATVAFVSSTFSVTMVILKVHELTLGHLSSR
jgi:hypothetical protein